MREAAKVRAEAAALRSTALARIGDLIVGYRAARVLFAGSTLGVFDALVGQSLPAATLARRLGTRLRPTGILLDALSAAGFLSKRAGRYANTPAGRELLVRSSPRSLGANLRYQELLWEAWGDLTEVARSGQARRPLDRLLREKGSRFVREYIEGMFGIAQAPAREVAAVLAQGSPRKMLDVGCGPGTFSLAMLEHVPSLEADLLDLPLTLGVARRILRGRRALSRARLVPGDYLRADLGRERFDLILLSQVTHDEGPRDVLRLLRKAWRALRPGGKVAVHDFALEEDGTRPLFSALFAVHMLVSTRAGRVYTAGEYRAWLAESGFSGIRRHDICAGAPNATVLFVGTK